MEAWAIVLIVILGIVILITGLYFMSLWTKCDRMDKFKLFEDKYIAHRGLFENGSDHPENSLAAFKRAVEEDFGIELDVQLTKDDKLVVFHDGDLKRICGINKKYLTILLSWLKKILLWSLKLSLKEMLLTPAGNWLNVWIIMREPTVLSPLIPGWFTGLR